VTRSVFGSNRGSDEELVDVVVFDDLDVDEFDNDDDGVGDGLLSLN